MITGETTFCIDLRRQKMQSVILSDGTVGTDFSKGNLMGTARTMDMVNGAAKQERRKRYRNGPLA